MELSPCPQWVVDFATRGKRAGKAKPLVKKDSPEGQELLRRVDAMAPLTETDRKISAYSPELEATIRAAAAHITFVNYDVHGSIRLDKVRAALESARVEFIEEDGGGAGEAAEGNEESEMRFGVVATNLA